MAFGIYQNNPSLVLGLKLLLQLVVDDKGCQVIDLEDLLLVHVSQGLSQNSFKLIATLTFA